MPFIKSVIALSVIFFFKSLCAISLETPTLKKGIRVGVYTGAFDPFHIGHAAIVDRALALFPFVVVHEDQEFKHNKPNCTHYKIRFQMLQALYNNHPRVLLSSERLVDVMLYLKSKKVIIVGITGSDNLTKSRFYAPDEWVVHVRPSDVNNPEVKNLGKTLEGKSVQTISVPNGYISSTMIRNCAGGKRPEESDLIPPEVRRVIKRYKLYRDAQVPKA